MTLQFPSPHPGIINFFSSALLASDLWSVSVPSSGDYQFLLKKYHKITINLNEFPSPHPGIINFFLVDTGCGNEIYLFPSPHPGIINFFRNSRILTSLFRSVSVPSSGDYQFLLIIYIAWIINPVSVPSSGDYQFLPTKTIRSTREKRVSVPSSGDYQFLLNKNKEKRKMS